MCVSNAIMPNTMPFYVRDLSIHEFWYPGGSWDQYPLG